jgi:hypothetical protein
VDPDAHREQVGMRADLLAGRRGKRDRLAGVWAPDHHAVADRLDV